MKVNLETKITDLKGIPVLNGDERVNFQKIATAAFDDSKPEGEKLAAIKEALITRSDLTIGDLAVTALQTQFPDEQHLSADQKVARFRLAVKLSTGGEQDLKAEDVSLLKTVIGKGYNALIVGRAWEILDPQD